MGKVAYNVSDSNRLLPVLKFIVSKQARSDVVANHGPASVIDLNEAAIPAAGQLPGLPTQAVPPPMLRKSFHMMGGAYPAGKSFNMRSLESQFHMVERIVNSVYALWRRSYSDHTWHSATVGWFTQRGGRRVLG
jgi:hypothetical protein